jgi:dTDP-6-deoxy-L-talose 4-dehydrogenase (NAD+)
MKIAVLGGGGYIGSRICNELLNSGHEVVCIARNIKQKMKHVTRHYELVKYDISQEELNINLFNYFKEPDIVIDAAWENLDDYSNVLHVNRTLESHYAMIENLVTNGLTRLTVLGTCAEYGLQEGELFEDMETAPFTNYAKAKDLYRKKVFALRKKENLKVQWPRLFYFYGLDQPRNAIFSQLLASTQELNKEFNMSCGEQIRDYLHIDQVVKYICKISTYPEEIGLINICSGNSIMLKNTVREWIEEYSLDVKINLCYYDYPSYEPFSFWGSTNKLLKYRF